MRKSLVVTIAIILMALPSTGNAAAWCSGNITNTFTTSSGEVVILGTWRGTWTSICNVKQEWKGVPPEVCYVWFSHVSNAITENKTVTVQYSAIDQTECATMPTYSTAPAPYYVMLNQ
ncbi:MAG: hypothetical protein ABJN65_00985 [Parasphingorhabdus sp.]